MDPTAQLSEHFSFLEMTRTDHRSYLEVNRRVPEPLVAAGRALAATLLEPVRARFGPVVIHSAYRCPPLNDLVGGSATSQHMRFEAADFHCPAASLEAVWEWIWKESGLPFGQLILEGWAAGHPGWLHLSLGAPWRTHDNGMVMTMIGGRYATVARVGQA